MALSLTEKATRLTLLYYRQSFRRKFALSTNGSGSHPAAAAAAVILGPIGTRSEYQIHRFNLFVIIVIFLVKNVMPCLYRSKLNLKPSFLVQNIYVSFMGNVHVDIPILRFEILIFCSVLEVTTFYRPPIL